MHVFLSAVAVTAVPQTDTPTKILLNAFLSFFLYMCPNPNLANGTRKAGSKQQCGNKTGHSCTGLKENRFLYK